MSYCTESLCLPPSWPNYCKSGFSSRQRIGSRESPSVFCDDGCARRRLKEARATTTAAFIKPANDKCFAAQVYGSGQELPGCDTLDDSTPVLIAEPVRWTVEYRCFVLDRELRTSSPYLRDGGLARNADGEWEAPAAEERDASEFAGLVLSDSEVHLPPAVVLDVGIIRDRGWAVVEANAAWGSGIYGCDPDEVLKVVQRSCIRRVSGE
jgi:hypothetical protein